MISRKRSPVHFLAAILVCAILTNSFAALSEKLRVLSCDVPAAPTYDRAAFKGLLDKADPDILFVQGVADWDAADQIAKLRPGLRVLTCSAFAGSAGQVAILARDKALLSWVEPVSTGGG